MAASTACSWAKLEKPRPPDTTELRAEFDAPTADLEGLPLEQSTRFLLEAIARVDDFCGFSPFDPAQCPQGSDCARCPLEQHIADVLGEIARALDGDGGAPVSIPGIDGTLQVQSTCRGWAEPSPDPAHGHVEANLSFSGEGLDPVVWGHAFACEERTGQSRKPLRYEGDFILSYEPETIVPYDRLHSLRFVLSYDGTIYDGDLGLEIPLQAATRRRLDGTGPREFLVDTPRGSLVAELGMGAVVIRASSGSFRCDITERACSLL